MSSQAMGALFQFSLHLTFGDLSQGEQRCSCIFKPADQQCAAAEIVGQHQFFLSHLNIRPFVEFLQLIILPVRKSSITLPPFQSQRIQPKRRITDIFRRPDHNKLKVYCLITALQCQFFCLFSNFHWLRMFSYVYACLRAHRIPLANLTIQVRFANCTNYHIWSL